MNELAPAKATLRTVLRDRRDRATVRPDGLVAALLDLPLPSASALAGVWPLPGEPDLRLAWHRLHARGHPLLLPETTPRNTPLAFRLWSPDTAMQPGRFGTSHPDGPYGRPDIVFVPLLGWDRRLHRLGYGGGYYDRTLASLTHAIAIGFGFSFQEVDEVPAGPHDIPLSAMVTERGLVVAEGQDFADIVSGRHRRAQRA